MPSKALVVLLTETAMEMHVVIPEVEAVTALVDSLVEVGETLEEGVTPTEMQIHVVTKEAMGEGISRNRMAHGATWVDSRTVWWEEDTIVTAILIHSIHHPHHLQGPHPHSQVHLNR